jgi:hypothetical protein
MSALLRPSGRLHLAIREIGITATSPIEARRLADALPLALERAFRRLENGGEAVAPPRPRPADRVAADIARAVVRRLERGP